MSHFLSYTNYLFTHIPQIDAEWTEEMRQAFVGISTTKDAHADYLPLAIEGTTFSGHSFRTTVGNTLNSIFETYYYIQESGIPEPWLDKRVKVLASGDDVIIMTDHSVTAQIAQSIRRLACPEKSWPGPYGIS